MGKPSRQGWPCTPRRWCGPRDTENKEKLAEKKILEKLTWKQKKAARRELTKLQMQRKCKTQNWFKEETKATPWTIVLGTNTSRKEIQKVANRCGGIFIYNNCGKREQNATWNIFFGGQANSRQTGHSRRFLEKLSCELKPSHFIHSSRRWVYTLL